VAGILESVGQDHDELVGRIAAAALGPVEQELDGVVQRGAPTWLEPVANRAHGIQGPGVDDDFVGVIAIELDDGDRGLAARRPLLGEEPVEAGDDVVGDRLHRARAVEEEPDRRPGDRLRRRQRGAGPHDALGEQPVGAGALDVVDPSGGQCGNPVDRTDQRARDGGDGVAVGVAPGRHRDRLDRVTVLERAPQGETKRRRGVRPIADPLHHVVDGPRVQR
jgi:hypothetical protein